MPLAACTVTVTGRLALPPGPVQLSVNILVSLNGPTLSLPDVGLLPDHAPPALHEVALVVDQLNVEVPLALTVVGLAVSVMVGRGGGATVTVTD